VEVERSRLAAGFVFCRFNKQRSGMKGQLAPEVAEARVTAKYKKLHKSLLELVDALNVMEPGGTLVDDVTITTKGDGKIRVAYVATPLQVRINTPERTFILKVIENIGDKQTVPKESVGRERIKRQTSVAQ
jgi:hypothetical protein